MIIRKPSYFDSFHCIAGACPDSCCQLWEIQIDCQTAAYYRQLRSPLGDSLRNAMRRSEGETILALQDGKCPMWMSNGLCRIQADLGESRLCDVCRTFPRLCHDYGSFQEHMLELSCPAAAKLILQGDSSWVETTAAGYVPVEYDAETMDFLLHTRSQALQYLSGKNQSPEKALEQFLLYAFSAQRAADGMPATDTDEPLQDESGNIRQIADFFKGLEVLTPAWKNLLNQAQFRPIPQEGIFMARYLVNRYWLQAVSDLDLYGRSKMIVLSVLLVGSLPGDFCRNAQLWSKEIENDIDNMDSILDAAYEQPAFSDSKLFGLLNAANSELAYE